jgi:hypothetical protein
MEHFARALTTTLYVYLAVGLVFALVFVVRGVERVDPAAHGGTRGFRALIVPGCAALWPLLLARWLRAAKRGSDGA